MSDITTITVVNEVGEDLNPVTATVTVIGTVPAGPPGAPGSASGVTDGDKGDITVSGTGTVWTIDAGVVTPTKLSFDPATQAELDAEAVLARNGDNITSGTVADARIASTIARDSEVTAAVDAEAALARNADNLASGTVADARIASTIARDSEVTSAISALSTVYQPLDSDLTAIAALTTTSYGRAFLALADAAAARTALGLGTAALSATGDFDAAGAAAAAQAASQPLDSDLTAIAALTTTSFGRGLLALADAAALRTSAGLVLGTDIYSKSAVDTALGLKADLASPALTGNPTAPTPLTADSDTSVATTAHAHAVADAKVSDTAYDATSWNGVTDIAPSKNAVRDKIEAMGSGVSDGDKGDITVSGSGATWTIDDNTVTLAKLADIATARILGRTTASTGDPEALTAAQVKALLAIVAADISDFDTQVATTAVLKSLFDANTILAATTDNTPAALTVGASTFLGRKASGNIAAMSVAEAVALLATTLAADAAFSGTYSPLVHAGSILGQTFYEPSSDLDKSITSTTGEDVDATNLAVTFTAPPSGNVIVWLSASVYTSTTQHMGLGIRESTTNLKYGQVMQMAGAGATSSELRATIPLLVTGISAGSHTYKMAARVGSGTGNVRAGDDASHGPASIIVFAL